MKYLYRDHEGITQFDPYFKYIESIKNKLPNNVYEFASSYKYYNLEDHSSLHDAWIECINVYEREEDNNRDNRQIEIEVSLLGQYHDRRIQIIYYGVTSYKIIKPESSNVDLTNKIGHGDLSIHEIRIENNYELTHEIIFCSGSTIIIKFKDIKHTEIIL